MAERAPNAPVSPNGGRPAIDTRNALRGSSCVLDIRANWKDLPRRFGPKCAVHRWFSRWVREDLFEFKRTVGAPDLIMGDKACGRDALNDECTDSIVPHRKSRRPESIARDSRPLRRYERRRTVERIIFRLSNSRRRCSRYEKSTTLFQGPSISVPSSSSYRLTKGILSLCQSPDFPA